MREHARVRHTDTHTGGPTVERKRQATGVVTTLVLFGVALLALLVAMLPMQPDDRGQVMNVTGLALTAVAAHLAHRAARTSRCHGTTIAWRWLTVALSAGIVGRSILLLGGGQGMLLLATQVVAAVVAYSAFILGLLSFPSLKSAHLERSVVWLDGVIVVVGGALVLWQLAERPGTLADGALWTLALVRPLADLVALAVAVTAARRARRVATGSVLAVIALSLLMLAVSDMGRVLVPPDAVTIWPEATWLSAQIFLMAACQAALAGGARDQRLEGVRRTLARAGRTLLLQANRALQPRLLPYTGLALGNGLLVAAAVASWPSAFSQLAMGTVTLTLLLIVRQLVVEMASQHTDHRFRSLVQHSSDVITIVDEGWRVRYASPAAKGVFGHAPQELLGHTVVEFLHADDVQRARRMLFELAARPGASGKVACRVRRADGSWCHTETVVTNQLEVASIGGLVLNTRDVSERMELEERLTHQATHDPLTGLANRVLFHSHVDQALRRAGRGKTGVAVLFVDLDDFKRVNDSLGHAEGDRLLVTVAQRLLNATRGCDLVARLGGDEFAILIENVREEPDMFTVAERVLDSVRSPVPLNSRDVLIGLSIGVARATADNGPDDLLRNADVAMYISKNQGKGSYRLFRPEMHAQVVERVELETDMRKMLDGPAFSLHFQPIVSMGSGRVTGVEALVRWNHPTRGSVPPSMFIPIAEESRLIVPLGYRVLREACTHAAGWQAARRALAGSERPLSVTVNLSGRQLHETGLVSEVASVLHDTGLAPSSLVLEVTESVMMQDTEITLRRLRELKALGIQIAIDDFGTGYSSLAYLQRFPIDIMKIDRAFVVGVARSTSDTALVRAVLSLADSLGMHTVAEGIEDDAQRTTLLRLGCRLGQGYLFARPLAVAEMGALLGRDDSSLLPDGSRRLGMMQLRERSA